MHDLNQIHQLNNKAVEASIPKHLYAGRIVVAEYAGLHFTGYETFSGEGAKAEAEAKLAQLNAQGGSVHGKIYFPETVAA
jgi:hypothetical protein